MAPPIPFQNAPSGVLGATSPGATVGAVPQVAGSGNWLATQYQIAASVELPTTAWQPGGPERTILATEAVCFALSDAVVSQMAQGGFLGPAATGTVTYTAPDGSPVTLPVTPDPSNAAVNPTGAPGYLDLLAANVYGTPRERTPVIENNLNLLARCQAATRRLVPVGQDPYTWLALNATLPPFNLVLQNGPIAVATKAPPAPGLVTTIIASTTPASTVLGAAVTPGASQLPVSGITAANPAVITCTGPHGYTAGQTFPVIISGTRGALDLLQPTTYTATATSSTAFSIPVDTSAASPYAFGGRVQCGDLGLVDQLIQQVAVPDNTTARTVSALAFPIQVTATVNVPTALVSAYKAAVGPVLAAQLAEYAIGGNAPDYVVAYDDIIGALGAASVLVVGQAPVAHVQSCSVNSQPPGVDIPFPGPTYQALLVGPVITVQGV